MIRRQVARNRVLFLFFVFLDALLLQSVWAQDQPPQGVIHLLDPGVSRMAPASVHVHATDSSLGSGNWQTAKFEWDFGDASANRLRVNDPRKANKAVEVNSEQQGFNASYIYQEPGTYTITLKVTNEAGLSHVSQHSVNILPNTRTVRRVSSSNELIAAFNNLSDNTSIQLARGSTYSINESLIVDAKNILIEPFGTGAKPVISLDNPDVRQLFWLREASRSITMREVVLQRNAAYSRNGTDAIITQGQHVTLWGLEFLPRYFSSCVASEAETLGLLVFDSVIGESYDLVVSAKGTNLVYLGSSFGTSVAEHILRNTAGSESATLGAHRINVSWNKMNKGQVGKSIIRFSHVQFGIIFRNLLIREEGGDSDGRAIELSYDVADHDYSVVDGNYIRVSRRGIVLQPNAYHVMIRNNIIESRRNYSHQFAIGLRGDADAYSGDLSELKIRDVSILNNTFIDVNATNLSGRYFDAGLIQLESVPARVGSSNREDLPVGIEQVRFSNNLYIAHPDFLTEGNFFMNLESLSNFTTISNNIWPVKSGQIVNTWSWSEWRNLPQTSREEQENVTNAGSPSFSFYATQFEKAASNGLPVNGVFHDYHGNMRSLEQGVDWPAGAVDVHLSPPHIEDNSPPSAPLRLRIN